MEHDGPVAVKNGHVFTVWLVFFPVSAVQNLAIIVKFCTVALLLALVHRASVPSLLVGMEGCQFGAMRLVVLVVTVVVWIAVGVKFAALAVLFAID